MSEPALSVVLLSARSATHVLTAVRTLAVGMHCWLLSPHGYPTIGVPQRTTMTRHSRSYQRIFLTTGAGWIATILSAHPYQSCNR